MISKEIENCLHIMLALENPSIIVDLRTNNGFKGFTVDLTHFGMKWLVFSMR